MTGKNEGIKTGWAEADITPDKPVLLAGQFKARVSEGVMDPVTATALAVESGGGGPGKQAVMVSCDLATIPGELLEAVEALVASGVPELGSGSVFLGATHTHSAPEARCAPYGAEECRSEYKAKIMGGFYSGEQDKYGVWPCIGLEVLPPADYVEFAAGRIAEAVKKAWREREASGMAYGLGHAVVGRNRRLVHKDGTAKMYGRSGIPEFSHVEGYEDHSVYAMMTYNRDKKLTGIVVNLACPSQVSEQIYEISADFWHETRLELRRRFGEGVFILPQCAPAGDQSPHVLIGRRAEERMWRLKGRDAGQNAPRAEIAGKIANALGDILPFAEKEIDWNPEFGHEAVMLNLPRRKISEQDVEEALEEARPFRERFFALMKETGENPSIREKPRWYTEITTAYRRMERGERVKKRFELQKHNPDLRVKIHVLRAGGAAFATNPFELYLDYGVRIRELSDAVQTFLVQKAGGTGSYLPSARSIASRGYGSVPASTDVGPEGGDKLVDMTVRAINGMFS